MKLKGLRLVVAFTMIATLFTSSFIGSSTTPAAAVASIDSLPSIYTQSFDSLFNTGTTTWTDDTTILGWYASRTAYIANNGSSTSGALYSFGTASASDRALGSLASGSTNAITYGLRLKNNTTSTITSLDVSYTGEQWRNGGNATAQKLDFSYQVGATVSSLTAGTWTDVNELDFTSPIATTTAAALDGNAAANRTSLSKSISVSIPAGQEIMLRWNDINDVSNDHGLAVDDLTVTASGAAPVDNAPTVSSVTPAANASNVSVSSNIDVVFSEAVTTNAGWYTINCSNSGVHTATESGTGANRTLDPTTDFANNETCTVTIKGANVVDQDGTPNTMEINLAWSFSTEAAAGSCPTVTNLITIPALQGTSDTNTANGTTVTVRGVVVGDFQGAAGLNGFNIQDPTGDGNVATSDGVLIFVPAVNSAWFNFDVAVGDAVQVTGRATEFNGLTEIDNVTSIIKCGTNQVLAPTVVDLPETTNGELERYEGMLISIPETLTVDQNFFLGRFGQVTLSSDGRLYNPTNRNIPGSQAAIAEADSNARRLIVLDDAWSGQNPNPTPYIGQDNTLRAGDTVTGITGTLDFGPINSNTAIRDYRIQPISPVTFTRSNPRTAAPEEVGGNIKVASFNVLNYFNGNGQGGGFPTSRGASTLAEFNRQRTKIITAVVAINPDVLGVMEMENDGEGQFSAIQDLVKGLNDVAGAGTYAFAPQPSTPFGADEIKVALIYKPANVSLVGVSKTSTDPIFDRPPFAQTFKLNSNNAKFTVVMNHFKSKGSCPPAGDPNADQGDGQGCWNAKRVQQAQTLMNFINTTVKPAAGDDDVIIMGDLNAYGKENPITTITAGGYVNEIEKYIGDTAYSFVFDGTAGYLDHALASTSLDAQVTGVTEWHINADEPSVIDYNTEFKPQDLYSATPYRSSDHDPVIVGLNLAAPNLSASSKTVNNTVVQSGSLLTYTLTISNSSSVAASYMVTDTLDANLTYVSSTPTMTQNGQQLTAMGMLNANSSATYTVVVKVANNFTGTINNSATLTGDGTTRTLTAPAVTVVAQPTPASFVTSSKVVNTTTITAGSLLTYTITINNSGQTAATYLLTDTLDANLTYVSSTPIMTQNGQQLTATGIVNPNSSVTYTLVVKVADTFSGSIGNSATLSGDGTTRTLSAPSVTITPALKKIYLPLILKNG